MYLKNNVSLFSSCQFDHIECAQVHITNRNKLDVPETLA